MEKNIIKEEIIKLLEIIIEQSETICQRTGQIPQIETDIVLSNIRELYERYKDLDQLNKPKVSQSEPVAEKKQAPKIKKEEIVIKKTEPKEKIVIKEPEPKENIIKNELFPASPSPDLFTAHTTIADKFKDEKKLLNEVLSDNKTDKSLAAKMKKSPIKDLKAAIGINEKFKLINQLFEGNLQKYNENVSKLNEFSSFEEAEKCIRFLKAEYNWEETNEVYAELCELVTRRYQ
jgi:hypothetical protein